MYVCYFNTVGDLAWHFSKICKLFYSLVCVCVYNHVQCLDFKTVSQPCFLSLFLSVPLLLLLISLMAFAGGKRVQIRDAGGERV